METRCLYHNRILRKRIVKVPISPIAKAPNGSYPYRLVVYRVCPVPGCGHKVESSEEP